MLDLNAKIIVAGSESSFGDDAAAEDTGSSSSSSVVNVELDAPPAPPPPAAAAALIFDILKWDADGGGLGVRAGPGPNFVTRPFFPVAAAAAGPSPSSSPRPQWLNLSFADSSSSASAVGAEESRTATQQQQQQKQQIKKSRRGPRSRSSQYRGVTFYRRTGRWESHIWDCGKQVYLGGFDTAHAAARAYDRAAIKFRGVDADINFNVTDYDDDMGQMRNLSKEEFVQILRRQSTGFSRGSSKYRGVTLHKCGRWEARMGQFLGKKAYDKAAIKCNGREAVTNFDHSNYQGEIVLESNGSEGSDHNLDLNLGISLPSDGPKPNNDTRFRWNSSESVPNRLRPMIDGQVQSSLSVLSGATNQNPATCSSGIYPNFLSKHEERGAAMINQNQKGVNSSQRFLNWAWKINDNGTTSPNNSSGVTAMPVFSVAASSGFASTITSQSASTALSLNAPTNFVHSLCLPTLSAADDLHSQIHRS